MFMRLLDRTVTIVSGSALVVSTLLILINVANRYLVQGGLLHLANQEILPGLYEFADLHFSSLSAVADEVPGLLLSWVAFLGAYLALRDGGHIAFDMVTEKLPPKFRAIVKGVSDLLIAIFLSVLLYQTIRMIYVDGDTEIETAEIAQGWFMSVLVAFSVLMLIALVEAYIRRFKEAK
ncbi:TRAP transporter small permease [Vibrio penaeicida]|uniref:TRAP transporter small permease n=1 Tax=Vibrio penaeicida TaxID=104609 RepID=UPI000CEA6AA2|nr:TRAP transporter small permease subunit [Vibrio penaeicida]